MGLGSKRLKVKNLKRNYVSSYYCGIERVSGMAFIALFWAFSFLSDWSQVRENYCLLPYHQSLPPLPIHTLSNWLLKFKDIYQIFFIIELRSLGGWNQNKLIIHISLITIIIIISNFIIFINKNIVIVSISYWLFTMLLTLSEEFFTHYLIQ